MPAKCIECGGPVVIKVFKLFSLKYFFKNLNVGLIRNFLASGNKNNSRSI